MMFARIAWIVGPVVLLCTAAPAAAQTTGSVVGRVVDAATGQPVAGALVGIPGLPSRGITTLEGRFVLTAIPPGERSIRVEMLGYRTVTLEGVTVVGGHALDLTIQLETAPIEIDELVVRVDAQQLIEPQGIMTRESLQARELQALPIDLAVDAIELAPGVKDGHFRGGRIGQEVYIVDGLEVKNPLEASTQGFGFELPPTAVERMEVVTGGFGAAHGSALSGVVSMVTRRGNPDRLRGHASVRTDHWAPDSEFRGHSAFALALDGPVPLLGGTTFSTDLWAQGMVDAEPRSRGLTCVRPDDADPDVAAYVQSLRDDFATRHLHCPYQATVLPHQAGERLIGFLRVDRGMGPFGATASLLWNRSQQQLYTPAFKYNPTYQLGQRSTGRMGALTLEWGSYSRGVARHVTARAAAFQLDRYLGALDLRELNERNRITGIGISEFRFLGEGFARSPIEEQLAAGTAIPGYLQPGGSTGSPFGPAAEGILFTEGTPDVASWTRSASVGGDLMGEIINADARSLRAGGSFRLHRVEAYERVHAHAAGALPYYARIFPRNASAFVETRLAAADDAVIELGLRLEAFQAGIAFRPDRQDFLAPTVDTDWHMTVMPRFGVAMPVPGTRSRTAVRFNYGHVAQPPDFRFFLDTTIGDSLRSDIRRQGNPEIGFERGASYEVGLSHLLTDDLGIGITAFLKQLHNLVTASVAVSGSAPDQFTTADYGSVRGVELAVRAHWPGIAVRGGYGLQKAMGVSTGTWNEETGDLSEARVEFPLAFDHRHAIDLAVFAGRAAGMPNTPFGGALVLAGRSGFPFDRRAAGGEIAEEEDVRDYLPWTGEANARITVDLGRPPGCGSCNWRILVDGRNVTGRRNILGLRRDSNHLAPSMDVLDSYVSGTGQMQPIPRESPRYSQLADLNGDGVITPDEYRIARRAAALDRHDPSLWFGGARQLRIGLELNF